MVQPGEHGPLDSNQGGGDVDELQADGAESLGAESCLVRPTDRLGITAPRVLLVPIAGLADGAPRHEASALLPQGCSKALRTLLTRHLGALWL